MRYNATFEEVMSKRTIAEIAVFVIVGSLVAGVSSCASRMPGSSQQPADSPYLAPRVVGTIRSAEITESSGLAVSRCQNNVLWTHNDSGDDAYIFAIDREGDSLGTWRVGNARNIDWEDIAAYKDKAGKCFLYIGEIGDNKTRRSEHIVYRVAEPIVVAENAGSSRKAPLNTANADALRFNYPDYDQDAEALMVDPKTGNLYVVTKRVSGPAGVYRLRPDFGEGTVQQAEPIAEVSMPAIPNGLITGGDISPDGMRVILCDYTRAYEMSLPAGTTDFDVVWKQSPQPVELGERANGESIAYNVDGTVIYATSEKRKGPVPVIEVRRK